MGRRVYYDSAGNEIGLEEDAYHLSNTVPLFVQNVQTNADRIRSMTDEELAQMFWEKASCELCKLKKQYCSDDCKGTWLDWLREEAQ